MCDIFSSLERPIEYFSSDMLFDRLACKNHPIVKLSNFGENTDIDPDKIRPASAEKTQCNFVCTATRTEICFFGDPESISIRGGGSSSFL